MKRDHVVKCINIALAKGTLNHLEIEEYTKRVGYATSKWDTARFCRILNHEVDAGRIDVDESTDGFLLYTLP